MKLHVQLKRRKTAMFAAILVGAVTVAATAQVAGDSKRIAQDPEYPPPYENSKADRALKTFDDSHPKCALWTDWHKLCSRQEAGGRARCFVDTAHAVRPSQPFCESLILDQYYDNSIIYSAKESKSRARFDNPRPKNLPKNLTLWDNMYKHNRPFNGENFALDRKYSPCTIWELRMAEDGKELPLSREKRQCATNGSKGLPSCDSEPFRNFEMAKDKYSAVCVAGLPKCPGAGTSPPSNGDSGASGARDEVVAGALRRRQPNMQRLWVPGGLKICIGA